MSKRTMMFTALGVLLVAGGAFLVWAKVIHPSVVKAHIVGTWDDILDGESLEFKPDGTAAMIVKEMPVPGSYVVDGDGVAIVVNGKAIHFKQGDGRLALEANGVTTDVFAKRPPESSFLTIPCAMNLSGVLVDRGNGNFEAPESSQQMTTTVPDLTLMNLPDMHETNDGGTKPAGAECVGYKRSADDIVKDIRMRGQQTADVTNHSEAVFAVFEIRQ